MLIHAYDLYLTFLGHCYQPTRWLKRLVEGVRCEYEAAMQLGRGALVLVTYQSMCCDHISSENKLITDLESILYHKLLVR
jgi:hypothetical protein